MRPGAAKRVGVRRSRGHRSAPRRGLPWLVAGLLLSLAGFVPALPPAAALPAAPALPAATTSPSATPSGSAGPSTPVASPSPSPRPDPEGDRWVQLAVVGGGGLLGAVVMFMVIGGIIRGVNRRRYRR